MTQILDSLPTHYPDRVLCYYVNSTHKIQIVRIVNISGWYFERVVFPKQRIMFEALPEAQLEVHTTRLGQPILLEYIACNRLRIHEGSNNFIPFFALESESENFAKVAVLN
ncbi:MAG: DUF1830 domain-containing protein [Drouetiella hepatica Uher 2000/2452]|jgi:hypothetical protein|uniref:DUF1830 domain-containing protein n=1 Tax=Drouetiella hepatica Uher 2000/2452 TaxID=904376 RepID=A0A951QA04_9CYAN|nr:DUF1830 domain-containing protein [Drouetiella hepatica Uher 2000/2452]